MRVTALLAVAFVLSGCALGGTKTVTQTVTSAAQAGTANVKYFGTPISVTKLDAKRYALAIKPQLFLVGVTANVAFAAMQQNACQPLECAAVEDDRLVLPAGSRNLVFILPAKTIGTVLTFSGPERHMTTTQITAAQLSALVGGAKTPRLVEPLDSGLWLSVDADTVTSFVQQFQP